MRRNLRKTNLKTNKTKKISRTFIINSAFVTIMVIASLLMIFYQTTMAAPNNLPDSVTVTNSTYGADPFNPGHNSYEQHVASDVSKIMYCYDRDKELMGSNNTVVTYSGLDNDAGLAYIIENGYTIQGQLKGLCSGCTAHDEYMITQQAIWRYNKDHGKGSNTITRDDLATWDQATHTYTTGSNNTVYSQAVVKLLQGAENAEKAATTKYNIAMKNTITIAASGQNYETNQIGITTQATSGSYKVSITAPNGYYIVTNSGQTIQGSAVSSTTFNLTETFKIVVPSSSLSSGNLTIKVDITASFIKNSIAIYTPADPTIQSGIYPILVPQTVTNTTSSQATIPKAKLRIIKTTTDENGNVEYVKGAKLQISSTDDTSFSTQEWVTDGTVKEFTDLIPGKTYKITEVEAAPGFIKNGQTLTYTVKASDSYTTGNNIVTLEIKNTYTKLQAGKIDINTGEYIKGATLAIIDAQTGETKYTIQTEEEPTTITRIPVGSYILQEIEAPEGYILSETKSYFEITNTGAIQQSFIKNSYTKVSVKDQKITVSMVEKDFKIEIRNAKGKVVDSFTTTGKPHTTEELEVGKYTIVEVEASEGHVCLPSPIDVYVPEKGTSVPDILFSNDYTKVKISKVDITNQEELPGAEIEIRDENDKVIEKWTSTEAPHEIDRLPVGKYTLVETIAPEGYVLAENAVEFEVKATGDIQMVTMENEPKVEVPDTADKASIITYICGTVIIICGIGLIVYNVTEHKKKKK